MEEEGRMFAFDKSARCAEGLLDQIDAGKRVSVEGDVWRWEWL